MKNFMSETHLAHTKPVVCVESVSAREMNRERPKPRIPFLGLSLLRNQTETLATQAINSVDPFISEPGTG